MRVLLVEDDSLLGEGLETALTHENYQVYWCRTAAEALKVVDLQVFDLFVLDIGLPGGMDGFGLLENLRKKQHRQPVLLLTARDSSADKVKGLDAGADDYLSKPFDLDELLARLRALQRRAVNRETTVLNYGADLKIDTLDRSVTYRNQPVSLSRREYDLLLFLLEHQRQIFSKEQLEERLYAWGDEVASNAVEVHIHNIRKKIYSQLIVTVRGVGYVIRDIEP
ncbi:MAG: response regulator transcription factor [Pseudomonadales bacterium]|nr:response regulator transcription factor [Pseudomonadales bacterium]